MTSAVDNVLQQILPRRFPRPLLRTAASALGLDRTWATYETLRAMGAGEALPERLLSYLQITYKTSPADLAHIPRSGPAIVVANHPFGMLDAAVLLAVARQVRSDVRILANEWLKSIPELKHVVIPIDTIDRSARNVSGLRKALAFLRSGGLLIVFPAGAVSHFHWRERASVDPPWQISVTRLQELAARRGNPPSVIPAFIPGANSAGFHAAGMLHPGLRTALLARELLNKMGRSVEVRLGAPIPHDRLAKLDSHGERTEYLRWRTYVLSSRQAFKPNTRTVRGSLRDAEPVMEPGNSVVFASEIAQLPATSLLDSAGDLHVYLSGASLIPHTLREIGRLREITFRHAGEGTGRAADLDAFDPHYLHLFVWNAARKEIVAAYRLRTTDGSAALYTRTLFQFDPGFLQAMGPAIELGRSFVRPEYQKGFTPLLLLWKGIGKFVADHPAHKMLFGPVTISNRYQTVSRELMIAFLEKRAGLHGWIDMVTSRHAPARDRQAFQCGDIGELDEVVRDVEAGAAGIPVLLRQYLKLGGKLLSFSVDPEFSDALDGLIVVDLTKTEPRLVERYLGKEQAGRFFEFHKSTKRENDHGTQ